MVDRAGPRLYALESPPAEQADTLPVAERGACQRQLLEAFLVSRRATVGGPPTNATES